MMISRRQFFSLSVVLLTTAFQPMAALADENANQQLNLIRRENHVANLAPSSSLNEMAQYQANLMAEKQKLSHSVTWGNGFVARLRKFHIHGPAGENIAAGQKDIPSVYNAWMHSPDHRRNMVDPAFHHYGLARASSPEKPDYFYWAIVFGL